MWWDAESGFDSWNVYRGDLAVLRTTEIYTQPTGSNPLVARFCNRNSVALHDSFVPGPGDGAFYLVTGEAAGVEGDLGLDGSGDVRPNDNPCP